MSGTATWSHPHKQVTALSSSEHRSPAHQPPASLYKHATVSPCSGLCGMIPGAGIAAYLRARVLTVIPPALGWRNVTNSTAPSQPQGGRVPVSTGIQVPLPRR